MIKSVEETMSTLKLLQSVDDQLTTLRSGVAALSLRVDTHKKLVAELTAELEKKNAETKVDEKTSAMKELELKVIAEKIVKFRSQLTTLTSNKAYGAMMGEIAGEEARSAKAEEDVLKAMEKIETQRAGMEEIRNRIKDAQAAVKREEDAVAGDVRELSGRIRQITAERQALCQQIDKLIAEKYEKISRSKNGKAVVPVKAGICQGCNMGVTKQTIARLWAKKELLPCPNCARLMYLEGEVQ